jgi:hypothetical protein
LTKATVRKGVIYKEEYLKENGQWKISRLRNDYVYLESIKIIKKEQCHG